MHPQWCNRRHRGGLHRYSLEEVIAQQLDSHFRDVTVDGLVAFEQAREVDVVADAHGPTLDLCRLERTDADQSVGDRGVAGLFGPIGLTAQRVERDDRLSVQTNFARE